MTTGTAADVRVFGIRHHGPGSARSLRAALDAFEPDVVLLEGPADADPLVPLVADEAMAPPVALLAYVADDPRTAAFWPVIIGMRKSKELLYTGDSISGREAEAMGMVNRAVPADQLDDTVIRMAERIANQASDSLALQKRSVNTYFESIVYPAIHSATDTDAMYQFTDQGYLWQEKVRESMEPGGGGIKAAFEWRDAPYRDYRAAGR